MTKVTFLLNTVSQVMFAAASTALAQPAALDGTIIFSISGQNVSFVETKDHELVISDSCRKKSGAYKCEAYSAIRRVRLKSLDPTELSGGANPGSLLCKTVRGQVKLGIDHEGNENAFCAFHDGSFISVHSLYRYAEERNKQK
jgi:putative hemolysin